jgi:hypothetical protein
LRTSCSKEEIDLPAFDLLFDRFVKLDWGSNFKARNPLAVSKVVTEFMKEIHNLKFALTKEQLCKLVLELYGTVLEVTPPYNRLDALLTVAELE